MSEGLFSMKLSVKIFYIALTVALCLGLFVGCQWNSPVQTEPTTEPVTCAVRFTVLGSTVSTQTLPQGAVAEHFAAELPGVDVIAWQDAEGNTVDPFATPVHSDAQYTAVAYPQLRAHTPFLFADEQGFLRPDDGLTADDLYAALRALAAPGAEKYFPGMPMGSQSVSVGTLTAILEHFFPQEQVKTAFSDPDGIVLRAAFAYGMLELLDFDVLECLIPVADARLPGDVPPVRADAAYLLEASIAHTPSDTGTSWEQTELPGSYAPGFVNIDGYLYYVNEDGSFLRDGTVDGFTFADGRYTCGDGELDGIVAQILAQIQSEAPEGNRSDWLYTAYEYARDSFKYLGRDNHIEMGRTDWGVEAAKVMFTTQRGNCYNYAAAFWALARGLGYDAQVMSGVVLKDRQDHGWVFIELDGTRYLCDPEWEMVYRYERDDYTKDMYMLTMGEIGWWNYDWTP